MVALSIGGSTDILTTYYDMPDMTLSWHGFASAKEVLICYSLLHQSYSCWEEGPSRPAEPVKK
jgi:hypothetical protein